MLLSRRYITFNGGNGCSLLGIGRSPYSIRVGGRDCLGKNLGIVHAGDATATVVAAGRDDLFRACIGRPETVGERCRQEIVRKQVVAILAGLVMGISVLEMLQVCVRQGMPGDLVASRKQVLQLRPGL